ncbi:MAG: tyrosine-type recombinase/integrase [Rhodospirillales bacterium]|nr:tyrosine-type recombinase/integrase [Rhodospirillales bacterium]
MARRSARKAASRTAAGKSLEKRYYRIGEVSRLTARSIDSKRMLILIVGGKGGKDRYVMLSPRLLGILRAYCCVAQPRHWLFPGRNPDDPVSVGTLNKSSVKAE